ncbi:MAG: LysM peptidoglycan-binding domain-containing protein [Candidatus Promineifilaceae bacterium]
MGLMVNPTCEALIRWWSLLYYPPMISQLSIRSARGRWLLLIFIVLTLAPAGRSTAGAQADPASEMLQIINDYRASLGLPPFQYNGALAAAAQRHANWMAANVIYSHTGEGGSTPLSRATAAGYVGNVVENIVGGTSLSPNQGLIWWQNSPIHLNALISTRYYEAGTGFATNGTQNMYVLVVGRQSGGSPPSSNSSSDTATQPLIVIPIELAEPREDGSIVHEIQQGQAMWTIAAYYDVKLDYLYLINNFSVDDILHPGDEVAVRLADGQSPPPSPTPPYSHIVREGDSAWAIAGRFGITVDDFFWLNGLDPGTTLQPGDEVIIRLAEGQAPPPTPTPRTTHIVQGGDSAWTIAAIYNLTVEQLLAINDLSSDTVLRPGDELTIRQPTATPPPRATNSTPPAPNNTPAPESIAEAVVENNPAPSPIAVVDEILEETPPQPAPSPTLTSYSGSQNAGESGVNWLLMFAVGLAIAGAAALIIARRQR